MISQAVFKAFYSNQFRGFSEELQTIFICDVLHLSFNDLIDQPSWWVNQYIPYLMGKNQAEEAISKRKQRKSQAHHHPKRVRR